MLIDEDLAKEIGSGGSGARHQKGTMELMAIQVLQRVAHTYRLDLDFFFLQVLRLCATLWVMTDYLTLIHSSTYCCESALAAHREGDSVAE